MAQAIGETERLRSIKPIQPWDRAGVSESQWNEMDATGRHWAMVRNEDQSIRPTGDEALPFTWGPLLANLATSGSRALANAARNKLAKPYYHGTSKTGFRDIKSFAKERNNQGIWMTNRPDGLPNLYAKGKSQFSPHGSVGPSYPTGGRIYRKYLDPLAKKVPRKHRIAYPQEKLRMGYDYQLWPNIKSWIPGEKVITVLNEKAFLPPGGLPLPKPSLHLSAPALMDSMILEE